ncbi:MAG TPA: 30S ribosomal protein S20 [Pseudogracilibacillus sp.]|nr:30S ribosomal protein S20 [Pseudogracilibacillus sp.]
MANLKSAIKRVRVNEDSRVRNKAVKTNMRTHIKRVEQLVEENDAANAQAAFNTATKVIDQAVQKGVVHKNNGNRQKTKLAKKIREITA